MDWLIIIFTRINMNHQHKMQYLTTHSIQAWNDPFTPTHFIRDAHVEMHQKCPEPKLTCASWYLNQKWPSTKSTCSKKTWYLFDLVPKWHGTKMVHPDETWTKMTWYQNDPVPNWPAPKRHHLIWWDHSISGESKMTRSKRARSNLTWY